MTHAPPEIVWVVVPANLTGVDVDRTLRQLESYLRFERPYFLLFELNAGVPDALQRKKLIDHMRDHQTAIERWVLGLGVVVPSPLARKVMTAILWFASPKIPHRLFAGRTEAEAWVQELKATSSQR